MQRAFILTEGRVITHPGLPRDAQPTIAGGIGVPLNIRLGESLAEVEQRHILHTVRNCRTQDEAARMLGVSTKTLYNKLRLYESWRRNGNGGAASTTGRESRRTASPDQPAGDTTWN